MTADDVVSATFDPEVVVAWDGSNPMRQRAGTQTDDGAGQAPAPTDDGAAPTGETSAPAAAPSSPDAAHVAAVAEALAPRITAAMLAAYGLGRDDEAAGNPVRTPLDIVENSLPAEVPMSSNRGRDLRERIAQRIDQAWAVAKDRDRSDGGYRDGYLDGLEHAEGIARSASLTEVRCPECPIRGTCNLNCPAHTIDPEVPHVHLWEVTSWRSDFGHRHGGTATLTCPTCSAEIKVCPWATASLDLGEARNELDALAAENARLRAQVKTLRHGINHPYGGIDGCARCAIATTTTEDRPVPDHTDARALYFPADDHGNPTDCWHVQAGDYADEPDLVIVIEHAVSSEGKDRRESVAREVAALLNSRGGPMSDYFEQYLGTVAVETLTPLIEADLRERIAEVERLTALVHAKESWIDGAKVDLDAFDEQTLTLTASVAAHASALEREKAKVAFLSREIHDWSHKADALAAEVKRLHDLIPQRIHPYRVERDALAAENARLRAQVQAVEALLDNRDHGGDCHSWDKFRFVDGPHPCDCWRADLLAALIAPEHVISKPEPGDPLPSRCTCGWIGTDGAVEIHFISNLRAALATTEAGEES